MQIVTDSGVDLLLPQEQLAELNIHVVPLVVTLDGKSYREDVDIQRMRWGGKQIPWRLHVKKSRMPSASQPDA